MPAKLLAVAAYLIGLAGAGIFFAYVVGAGVGFWPRGEASDGPLPWLINVGWLLIFAIQHSGMARPAFKNWWTRAVPASWERSMYVLISGLLVAGLTFSWQPLPGAPIWHGPTWIVAISLLAGIGIGLCCRCFDHDTFFGLRQAWTGSIGTPGQLHTEGPYRFVRHPLMLGLLIALWAQPVMPPELLLMNAGMTIYILVAIRLEERGLVREFGDAYERYQHSVPALIPWKWW